MLVDDATGCQTQTAPAVAGGAMVGTLAINTMAPPAALKEVHPAAKMQTFRKVHLRQLVEATAYWRGVSTRHVKCRWRRRR